jgi:DNA polymerase-3 subunit epsilon
MLLLELKRYFFRRRVDDPLMQAFLQAKLPSRGTAFKQLELLVIDLETTSLKASEGEIASIGWVPIRQGLVRVAEAEHYFSRISSGVGQSAVIHHIHDSQLAEGDHIVDILDRLLTVAAGKVLVFHNATLDINFLTSRCLPAYGCPLVAPIIDTLLLERRKMLRINRLIPPGSLRLHSCRSRYGLSDFPQHDALSDALAAAELLLAWVAHAGGADKVHLNDCC